MSHLNRRALYLPVPLEKRIADAAARRNISESDLIREAVETYCDGVEALLLPPQRTAKEATHQRAISCAPSTQRNHK